MSKLIKPQRTNKHKKLKNVDPFYKGPRPIDRYKNIAYIVNYRSKQLAYILLLLIKRHIAMIWEFIVYTVL